jgi:cytochrome P450
VPRATGATYCNLPLGDKTHSIPPWTAVWGNVAAIQVDEQYWGPEAKVWRPSRWIRKGDSGDVEELVEAVGHAYIPWASGPRVCPGKKFAQVEIVAVVASLMHRHSVAAVLEEGETEASAQERLTRVIADSDMTLVMRMNHPQKLRVRWEKVAS